MAVLCTGCATPARLQLFLPQSHHHNFHSLIFWQPNPCLGCVRVVGRAAREGCHCNIGGKWAAGLNAELAQGWHPWLLCGRRPKASPLPFRFFGLFFLLHTHSVFFGGGEVGSLPLFFCFWCVDIESSIHTSTEYRAEEFGGHEKLHNASTPPTANHCSTASP